MPLCMYVLLVKLGNYRVQQGSDNPCQMMEMVLSPLILSLRMNDGGIIPIQIMVGVVCWIILALYTYNGFLYKLSLISIRIIDFYFNS